MPTNLQRVRGIGRWLFGVSVLLAIGSTPSVSATVRYVDLNNPNPSMPFTNWPAAATSIQDAVDAADVGDEIVVANGVYQTGGRVVFRAMTNRVAVTKPLTVRSVNGPTVTVIRGYQVAGTTNGDGAVRCVSLAAGATLSGFTLFNGATRTAGDSVRERSGGGVWCESTNATVSNCVLIANSAHYIGGGVHSGTLNTCTLAGNSAGHGGGAYDARLNFCTLTDNSATWGGGAALGTLNNCQLTGNWAHSEGGGAYGGTDGTTLTDCTLTANSAGDQGGGAASTSLNNCVITGNWAAYRGGGAYSGTLTNCTLFGNSATNFGGGAYGVYLNTCTLTTNSAKYGGGAYGGKLVNCTLTGNSAATEGGGAYGSELNDCALIANWVRASGGGASGGTLNKSTLTGNSATNLGGGAYNSILNNCTLGENSAFWGGGAYSGTLNNCALITNWARSSGGGAYAATLNNCTLTGNSATNSGGGAASGQLNNCIVYYNTGGNYSAGNFYYSCTTPLPSSGTGNFTNAPLFVDLAGGSLRLQPGSPCLSAGNLAFAVGTTDLDGRPRIVGGGVDVGAYEYQGSGMSLFIGWLQRYGLATDGSAQSALGFGASRRHAPLRGNVFSSRVCR